MGTQHDWAARVAAHGKPWLPSGEALTPWAYQRPDGSTRTCAGNCYCMLAVDGHHVPTAPIDFKSRKSPDGMDRVPTGESTDLIFAKPVAFFGRADVAELRALAGPPHTSTAVAGAECPECDGSGEVECYACGREEECKDCKGKGVVGAVDEDVPPERHVRIGRGLFDLWWLAQMLPLLPDASVRVGRLVTEPSSLVLAGDGWAMLTMGLTEPTVTRAEEVAWSPGELMEVVK